VESLRGLTLQQNDVVEKKELHWKEKSDSESGMTKKQNGINSRFAIETTGGRGGETIPTGGKNPHKKKPEMGEQKGNADAAFSATEELHR